MQKDPRFWPFLGWLSAYLVWAITACLAYSSEAVSLSMAVQASSFSMATTLGAKTLKASSQRMLQILRYSLNGSRRVVSIVDRLVRKKLRKRIEQDFCCLEKR